ncbi:molecular chaperone HtpG [Chryseobacterium defluvii]|uniref:Molecular chaperone HtpG n=1 Tax=Chryseobacterium defluvii TaxID=160396 RepID=A0A840K6G7_9FLAO|nr:ATP-binding protein [Chryseobacterium defluvii]MBB4804799.1 molecular chaperone HtpG [Chryseobacterium defluvii]
MDNNFKTIIGKDVIESLTIGMYDDSRFIYREYIQNAADQIDKARQQGLIEEGEIHIVIDAEKKLISIEDDATGIEENKVVEILKNIAQSTKKRGINKGFRGIGRLGGLGYCEKLVFETSFKGEAVKSIMTWDAKKLKAIINDREQKEEASDVIDAVTTLETKKEDANKHYFKVSLIGVSNKDLLDVKEIRTYLSMVAPVAFNKSFVYAKKIYDELKKEEITVDEYKTFINTEQLFKGYNSYIYEGDVNNKKKIGEVIDVLFFKDYDPESNKLFWGWYGITEKNQSLNQVNFARGLRLRKANIQIGNESTLTKLHRDKRFQFYFFGEVYGLHQDLIPNARRDYFSETETFYDFENKLKSFFHTTIHKLCYTASDVNSAVRTINSYNEVAEEFEKKKEEGFVDKEEQQSFLENLKKKKEEAEKAERKLESIKTKSAETDTLTPITKIIERATLNHTLTVKNNVETEVAEEPVFRTDKLIRLNKQERKFLGNIFTTIRNVLPKETAELLILKIEEDYK